MLTLAEVEEGHDGSLFVLRWIALEDLLDEALILGCEFELNRGVVVICVPMLGTERYY